MQNFSCGDPYTRYQQSAGGGAWGTALAIHAAKMGHATLLWAREPEVVASVNGATHENTTYLKASAPSSKKEFARGSNSFANQPSCT